MKHIGTDSLSQETCQEWRDCSPRASSRRYKADRRRLKRARKQPHKHYHRTWGYRAKHIPNHCNGNGVADDGRKEPDQELEYYGAASESENEAFLAQAGCGMGESESAEGNTALILIVSEKGV
jgi:hypothetical protein